MWIRSKKVRTRLKELKYENTALSIRLQSLSRENKRLKDRIRMIEDTRDHQTEMKWFKVFSDEIDGLKETIGLQARAIDALKILRSRREEALEILENDKKPL